MSRKQVGWLIKGDGHVDDGDWVHGGDNQVGSEVVFSPGAVDSGRVSCHFNGFGKASQHSVMSFRHCGHTIGASVEDVGGGLQWASAAAAAFVGDHGDLICLSP